MPPFSACDPGQNMMPTFSPAFSALTHMGVASFHQNPSAAFAEPKRVALGSAGSAGCVVSTMLLAMTPCSSGRKPVTSV